MALVSGASKACLDFLKIFGLEDKHVSEFILHMSPNSVVTVTAKMNVIGEDLEELGQEFKKYSLVKQETETWNLSEKE